MPRGQSKLPEGSPAGRGVPLSDDVPGVKTFVKPQDAPAGEHDKMPWVSDRQEINDAYAESDTGYYGKGPWEGTTKTRYPYRDGLPHTHNASSAYVVGRFQVEFAPPLRVVPGSRTKIALNLGGITEGLNPAVMARGAGCVVALKRADLRNLRWILTVDCGNIPRVVKVKAFRKGGANKLSKLDLDLTCSCPAWRWQGAEHHSKREDYLDGEPRGTASVPVIRDPMNINRVCKHVFAVLEHVKNWTAVQKRKKK